LRPHNRGVRALIIALVFCGACRRKPPVAVVENAAPQQNAATPENAAVQQNIEAVAPEAAQNLPPPPAPTGHAPTDDELRAGLKPLLPAIAKCVVNGPVTLRFALSPSTGRALLVRFDDKADECAAEALKGLRFEPWSAGAPSLVAVPLGKDGQPMTETDGGLK
jgi:hypothetical protein